MPIRFDDLEDALEEELGREFWPRYSPTQPSPADRPVDSTALLAALEAVERRPDPEPETAVRTLEADPHLERDPHALVAIGVAYMQLYEDDLARPRLLKALDLTKHREARICVNLSTIALNWGDLNEAREWARKAIKASPRYPGGHIQLLCADCQDRDDDVISADLDALERAIPGWRCDPLIMERARNDPLLARLRADPGIRRKVFRHNPWMEEGE
ncbi:hypothetical protein JL100_030330 (plasmid) [Skermanella mucosa]|uniref:hypothetical protein n=1 Tax=Skermanella mucosa TaxID=1789672 RepID=UPI00192A751F|nr:hypothetical protein [Skermanella mucosa]UEM24527.1 hypothetical protein JL100_030330 [Skermanella mucosa]